MHLMGKKWQGISWDGAEPAGGKGGRGGLAHD